MDRLEFSIYMKDSLMADVLFDRDSNKLEIVQYSDNIHLRPFYSDKPSLDELVSWINNRCFPETRANKDQLLDDLGLKVYSPLAIIKKTHGLQHEDYYWVRFKGEELNYSDIKIRD